MRANRLSTKTVCIALQELAEGLGIRAVARIHGVKPDTVLEWLKREREYLVHHLHLALACYHFTRYHASLRVKLPEPIPTRGNGVPKKWHQRTPARPPV